MQPNPRRIVPVVLAVVLVGSGLWWGYQEWLAPEPTTITATGTIEATQFVIAPERSGRIADIAVEDGEAVSAGQMLVTLESDLLLAQREQAEAAYVAAQQQAQAAEARLQLEQRKAGVANEHIRAIEAEVEAARAGARASLASVRVLDIQIGKMTLTSPIDGVVIERTAEPGEMAMPGGTLLVLADLRHLEITVYVPEDQYGHILLKDHATLTVDTWPEREFPAVVSHIASEAEFTPRNVQTVEGRKLMVFAVTLEVENPDGWLKPGMPADVVFDRS